MNLIVKNLNKISGDHGLSKKELLSSRNKIKSYLKNIEDKDQGFYKIINELGMVDAVETYARLAKGKFKDIVVLGIGGSSLGTICLQQSLKHLYENELTNSRYPKLHVIDNVDPELILALDDIISLKDTLFVVISKSGTTPEPMSQFFYYFNKIKKAKLNIKNHLVFITDTEKGLLREIANKEGIFTLDVPDDVGGRFSVLTPVGLLPAALIGIDIRKLLKGARRGRDLFLDTNIHNNLPFQIATMQYLLYQKGKVMNVIMPYSNRLIKFADWYKQLLAESIGKEKDNNGNIVNVGITPLNALGATDQHSQLQLFNEGPNDKFIIFINIVSKGKEIKIPNPYPNDKTLDYLKGVTFNQLLKTEMLGTADAITHNNRPNITIEIEKVNEESLGELFMIFEGATAFLGEFFNINAYNQPGVEMSKVLTKKYLLKK